MAVAAERVAPLTVLVAGASGHLGRHVVSSLLGTAERMQRLRVLALTRSAAASHGSRVARKLGAAPMEFDLLQDKGASDALAARLASEGVDVVVGMHGGRQGAAAELRMGQTLIDAARAAGSVTRFIFVSLHGADSGVARRTSPQRLQPKADTERHLERSGLPFTHLRLATLMDNVIGPDREAFCGLLRDLPADVLPHWVAARDVGEIVRELILKQHAINTAVTLATDRVAWPAIEASLESAFQTTPDVISRRQSKLNRWFHTESRALYNYFCEFEKHATVDTEALRTLHPGLWKFSTFAVHAAREHKLVDNLDTDRRQAGDDNAVLR